LVGPIPPDASGVARRWLEHDRRLAQSWNEAARITWWLRTCRIVSRLGDGLLWYGLMIGLPWFAGERGWVCARHMFIAGTVSLVLNKALKRASGRPRPYRSCSGVHPRARALDEFSFPSGHTFHAVGFSLVFAYHFPVGAAALVPFTLLLAVSRVVLGLHYPSDVLAGALLGALVGLCAIWLL
jgi:undecaprenyl-diphosphatase